MNDNLLLRKENIRINISDEYDFNDKTSDKVLTEKYGTNWPVVYILYNKEKKEVYIGETLDASSRMKEHWLNYKKRNFSKMRLIMSDKYNKSATLDLEAFLIEFFWADALYTVTNGNGGQNNQHEYYQRHELYEKSMDRVWNRLVGLELATKKAVKIRNENLYKFSPFKQLEEDQIAVMHDILHEIGANYDKGSIGLIKGGAGTGKTILAIFLLKLLATAFDEETGLIDEQAIEDLALIHKNGEIKVGIVLPTANIRSLLKIVARKDNILTLNMILGPSDVCKDEFDILIVDEAHRLMRRKNLTGYGNFDRNNVLLGLDKNQGTQLDWILKRTKHSIFLYDEFQTIKPTDVLPLDFMRLKTRKGEKEYYEKELTIQKRCLGGKDYVDFIRSVFNGGEIEGDISFNSKYDFRIFDNVDEMVREIKKKDKELGLCRNVAGFAWKWKTKNNIFPQNEKETEICIQNGDYDIEIDGNKYIWNTNQLNWYKGANSVNEIGCIHTIQGFDLNYAGVIIGKDLRYDKNIQRLYADRDHYFDMKGKNGITNDELTGYIKRIYMTLCTRGIKGTYIYIQDENLKEYFVEFCKKNKIQF